MVATQWLEVRRLLSGVDPSGAEQEMLELLNHMRTDPAGTVHYIVDSFLPLHSSDPDIQSALSYFGVNGSVLQSEWTALAPVAPLAWNSALAGAAGLHSQLMLQDDTQSHQLPGELSLGSRLTAAGYTSWNAVAENVYAYAQSVLEAHAAFAIDWGSGADGMQDPRGHRDNMMSASYREVGIGIVNDSSTANSVGPLLVTQDFGNRTSMTGNWLVGTVYNDSNGDGRYEAGEGMAGVQVHVVGAGTDLMVSTLTAGGYQANLQPGQYSITFSGGGLAGAVSYPVTIGSANVMLDHLYQTAPLYVTGTGGNDRIQVKQSAGQIQVLRNGVIQSYASANVSAITIDAGAGDDFVSVGPGLMGAVIYGGDGNDSLFGGSGPDSISGGAGRDSIGGGAGADSICAGAGNDDVTGEGGGDTILLGAGDDVGRGGPGDDMIDARGGNDTLYGGAGDDVLTGGSGDDALYAADSAMYHDTVNGADGSDSYTADATDILSGVEQLLA